MDESTSALDVALESKCMTSCIARGITMISVGHRPTLRQFHQKVLHLEGSGGGWHMEDIPESEVSHVSASEVPAAIGMAALKESRVASFKMSSLEPGRKLSADLSEPLLDHTGLNDVATAATSASYNEVDDNPWNANIFRDNAAITTDVKLNVEFVRKFWRLFRFGGSVFASCSVR
jgi:hypothetical protein